MYSLRSSSRSLSSTLFKISHSPFRSSSSLFLARESLLETVPSGTPRIPAISVMPMGMDSVEDFLNAHTDRTVKYVIDRKLRWRIRDMLDQLNMSERTLFPGLDGLSRWIARHYFVKAKGEE